MSAFAFANAGMLAALIALPVIWYFLRLMPPKPRVQAFPPTRLLLDIPRKEEEPSRSPWWLTAIRLALAAAVILALAAPILRPAGEVAPGDGPLLMVVENGWGAAPGWQEELSAAHRILTQAEEQNRGVALLATAEAANQSLAVSDAADIRKRLDALTPRPWTPDRTALATAVTEAARTGGAFGGVAWLSDGLGDENLAAFAAALRAASGGPILAFADKSADAMALKPPASEPDALAVPVIRPPSNEAASGIVRASDIKGRVIGDAPFDFAAGETEATAKFALPVELRNDIVRIEVAGAESAGGVQLIDDRWRRRRVGLISGASADNAQPLLSPLYYISRAMQPFADVQEPREANAAVALPEMMDNGASLIVMADIGTLTPEAEAKTAKWVEDGGTLIRFAGPRLAASSDSLVPVTLRHGDRVLGGTLSWQSPQALGGFSETSPFAGLAVPEDVTVTRQVLADPDATLSERTWATLADGTPLVTAAKSGKGYLILFHVTADTSWSNLPLSGTFVEMLRRIVDFSAGGTGGDTLTTAAQPYRLLDGFGHFSAPTGDAEAISGDISAIVPGAKNPPGLYGSEDGFRALNLLRDDATLTRFALPDIADASVRAYPTTAPTPLAPWLFALAALLFAADALAVLWLNGGLAFRRLRPAGAALILVAALATIGGREARAADDNPDADAFAMAAVDKTHFAYVITGDAEVDATSRAGLFGLSRVLATRTALEPGEPIGVDPARDELAFFPLIYWPVVADTAMPSSEAMAKIDAYMRDGGSVLFDTRDQLERSALANGIGGTPNAERLRAMLGRLDVPPLEPVPADHVLSKAFYLLSDFPGRYAGGPLWVEASNARTDTPSNRPASAGDGVSTILITENDLAGAWAQTEGGSYLYPTVPNDASQREIAYRVGVNIVMYTLTGNYKADQVHVPALLERLGQ